MWRPCACGIVGALVIGIVIKIFVVPLPKGEKEYIADLERMIGSLGMFLEIPINDTWKVGCFLQSARLVVLQTRLGHIRHKSPGDDREIADEELVRKIKWDERRFDGYECLDKFGPLDVVSHEAWERMIGFTLSTSRTNIFEIIYAPSIKYHGEYAEDALKRIPTQQRCLRPLNL